MIELLKEIAEPSRRMILAELRTGPRSVGELVALTGLKQPNVSNHLAKLRAKGVVRGNKVGRQVFYSLANPEVEAALAEIMAPGTVQEALPLDRETAKKMAKAAIGGDEATCTRIVDSFLKRDVSPIQVYHRLFGSVMDLLGKWYQVEAIDEAQEHLASAIVERLMARVLHYSNQVPETDRSVVLGCSEGNWHTIGLRMISDVMRLDGWKTLYLGANVPTSSFVASVKEHRPLAVMISCPIVENHESCVHLVESLNELRDEGADFKIAIGGRAVNLNAAPLLAAGADLTAEDLEVFVEDVLPKLRTDAPQNGTSDELSRN